jgi:hypothetical protein
VEQYRIMWQKTRSIVAFLYDHYTHEYDYFHIAGGDDMYMIVENLRNYLHLLESSTIIGGRNIRPMYLGLTVHFVGRFIGFEPPYNIGGPGYILNRLALQRLVTEALPTCRAEDVAYGEDLNVARCLFELGIYPIDTADVAHRQPFFIPIHRNFHDLIHYGSVNGNMYTNTGPKIMDGGLVLTYS